MIRSMTAYGRSDLQEGATHYVCEIRSLNNRYREIILRTPRNWQALEEALRKQLSARISRGRIEATIQTEEGAGESTVSLELNRPLLEAYVQVAREMGRMSGIDGSIRVDTLLQFKDMVQARPVAVEEERTVQVLRLLLERALDSFDQMRVREGAAIATDIQLRLGRLKAYLDEIVRRAPELISLYRERLQSRVSQLMEGVALDPSRMEQEVALFADRSDITEEVIRIQSHLDQFYTYLSLHEPTGRRLDFLLQEMHREVNTVSAKASDGSISRVVVEMKAELEKIREQVQNVE